MAHPDLEDPTIVRDWLWLRQSPFIDGYEDGSEGRLPSQSKHLQQPKDSVYKEHYLDGWKADFAAHGHKT